jgi:hypothetical protein
MRANDLFDIDVDSRLSSPVGFFFSYKWQAQKLRGPVSDPMSVDY